MRCRVFDGRHPWKFAERTFEPFLHETLFDAMSTRNTSFATFAAMRRPGNRSESPSLSPRFSGSPGCSGPKIGMAVMPGSSPIRPTTSSDPVLTDTGPAGGDTGEASQAINQITSGDAEGWYAAWRDR